MSQQKCFEFFGKSYLSYKKKKKRNKKNVNILPSNICNFRNHHIIDHKCKDWQFPQRYTSCFLLLFHFYILLFCFFLFHYEIPHITAGWLDYKEDRENNQTKYCSVLFQNDQFNITQAHGVVGVFPPFFTAVLLKKNKNDEFKGT